MKILLLGDSIRMDYGAIPEAYFVSKGYSFYQPQDNCRFAKYFLRMLFDYKELFKDADVIHFNIGHWDLCQLFDDKETFSSIEEYRNNLIKIVNELKKITPKIIFATTTPVRANHPHNDNKIIDKFNEAACEVMKEHKVTINDLNSLVRKDINRYICDDLIHLTSEGKKKCGEQVIKFIEQAIANER